MPHKMTVRKQIALCILAGFVGAGDLSQAAPKSEIDANDRKLPLWLNLPDPVWTPVAQVPSDEMPHAFPGRLSGLTKFTLPDLSRNSILRFRKRLRVYWIFISHAA